MWELTVVSVVGFAALGLAVRAGDRRSRTRPTAGRRAALAVGARRRRAPLGGRSRAGDPVPLRSSRSRPEPGRGPATATPRRRSRPPRIARRLSSRGRHPRTSSSRSSTRPSATFPRRERDPGGDRARPARLAALARPDPDRDEVGRDRGGPPEPRARRELNPRSPLFATSSKDRQEGVGIGDPSGTFFL